MRRSATVACVPGLALLLVGCGGGSKLPGDPRAGKDAFIAAGCGACHTFTPAGTSGQVGPNLDRALKGRNAAFVRESILAPDLKVEKGFSPGVMPNNFGRKLSDHQISDIVKFLLESPRPD